VRIVRGGWESWVEEWSFDGLVMAGLVGGRGCLGGEGGGC